MIKGIKAADIMDGLKRHEHILFSLPCEGGKAALERDIQDEGCYSFLHYLADEWGVPILDAPQKDFSAENLGTMWKFEDEENYWTYWGVYNHDWNVGWHPRAYELVQRGLDEWWEEVEGGIVRPARSLILGTGRRLPKVAALNGGISWNFKDGLAPLANTQAELDLFWSNET